MDKVSENGRNVLLKFNKQTTYRFLQISLQNKIHRIIHTVTESLRTWRKHLHRLTEYKQYTHQPPSPLYIDDTCSCVIGGVTNLAAPSKETAASIKEGSSTVLSRQKPTYTLLGLTLIDQLNGKLLDSPDYTILVQHTQNYFTKFCHHQLRGHQSKNSC